MQAEIESIWEGEAAEDSVCVRTMLTAASTVTLIGLTADFFGNTLLGGFIRTYWGRRRFDNLENVEQ